MYEDVGGHTLCEPSPLQAFALGFSWEGSRRLGNGLGTVYGGIGKEMPVRRQFFRTLPTATACARAAVAFYLECASSVRPKWCSLESDTVHEDDVGYVWEQSMSELIDLQ